MDVKTLAGTLRALAKGFFAVYLVVLLRLLIPIDYSNLAWTQALISGCINNAPIPLAGFGFLLLAALISSSARTIRLLLLASRVALPAALGFLLLVPLQGYVAYKAIQRHHTTSGRQEAAAQSQLAKLREQIKAATSSADLQSTIRSLPAAVIERAGNLPLDEAQQQLLAGIDQRQQSLVTLQRSQRIKVRWQAGKEAISNTLASLVLAWVLFMGRYRRLRNVFSAAL